MYRVNVLESEKISKEENFDDRVCLHLMQLANDIAINLDHKTAFSSHIDFLTDIARKQNCEMTLYFLEKAKESFIFEIGSSSEY